MRICLISPGHLSTNPRLVKEAHALTQAGHSISVVCGQFTPWARECDKALVDPRWHVVHVPFGPSEAPTATYLRQGVTQRVAKVVAMAGIAKLEILEAAHAVAALDLSSAAVTIPADLYIAHYVAALPAAARAARTFGGIYAFDAEDFHLGDLPDSSEHALEKRIIYEIESRYLPGAIYVTAASPKIADAYAEAYNVERPTVVLNVFPRVSSQQSSKTHGRMVPGPSIYWFSQTIGPGRGLETAIKAIAQAKSGPHLYLRGRPAKGYDQRLRLLAQSAGVEGHLHFLELAAPSDMERLGAEFDIGYTGETAFSRNNAFALGNKLFSYLQSGIPIVASNTPAHTDLAPDLGCAMGLFPIEDAGALACVIDYFLLDSNKLAVARSRAWQLGHQRYCWDVEQQVFLAVVERALARRFTVV